MSFTWPDMVLLAIMLISGLMSLMRGFAPEILSLVAWGGAAGAAALALFSQDARAKASELLIPYVGDNDIIVTIVIAGTVFLVVLILLSIISVKLSDALLDSSAGPIDRTLGFIYGLLRGLALMIAIFVFYSWLTPRDKVEPAVRDAALLPLITSSSSFVVDTFLTLGWMSPDLADDLNSKIGNPSTLGTRGDSQAPSGGGTSSDQSDKGYNPNQRSTLDQIIESTQGQQ